MPEQNRKAMEKELKNRIKQINKLIGSRVSYAELNTQIENILAMEEGARENALTEAYINLNKTLSEKVLSMRSIIKSNSLLEDKYRNHEANNHSVVDLSIYSKELIASMIELIDPENAPKYGVTAKQIAAFRDWEIAELKSHTSYNELPKCLEKWDRNCFDEDASKLQEQLPYDKSSRSKSYKYKGDKNDPRDVIAAEYFYKARLVREELAKHNFIWRLFNFRKVAACERYVEAVEEHLLQVNFNVDWEDDRPLDLLKDNVVAPHVEDAKQIDVMYNLAMSTVKASDPEPEAVVDEKILEAHVDKPADKKEPLKKEDAKKELDRTAETLQKNQPKNDSVTEVKEKINDVANNANAEENKESSVDEILRIKEELEAQLQKEMERVSELYNAEKSDPVASKESPANKLSK